MDYRHSSKPCSVSRNRIYIHTSAMKYIILFLVLQCKYGFASAQSDTSISIGKGFTYFKNKRGGEIGFNASYKDTTINYFGSADGDSSARIPIPQIIRIVIRDVNSLGYNDNYILVTSKNKTGFSYWVID